MLDAMHANSLPPSTVVPNPSISEDHVLVARHAVPSLVPGESPADSQSLSIVREPFQQYPHRQCDMTTSVLGLMEVVEGRSELPLGGGRF